MRSVTNALTWRTALLAAVVAAGISSVQAQDVDCTMCHDAPPVPDGHMEVDEVSVESCTMCHEADGADPFFRALHTKHADLGCDTCHEDTADREARLKEMLAQ
jgi:hypothetical protein